MLKYRSSEGVLIVKVTELIPGSYANGDFKKMADTAKRISKTLTTKSTDQQIADAVSKDLGFKILPKGSSWRDDANF